MSEVELTIDNSTKCVCPVCPVQADSACTSGKRPHWERRRTSEGDILAEYPAHPEAYDLEMEELEAAEIGRRHGFEKPDTENTMELYCAGKVSRSNCGDLDGKRACQCPTCTVWAAHGLDSSYYCLGKR